MTMGDAYQQYYYDLMRAQQENIRPMYPYTVPAAAKFAPDEPSPLPEPGVEVELDSAGNYKVRLTVEISPELISATKAQDRPVLIQVALSEAVKKAARQILGKIALARLKKSYDAKRLHNGHIAHNNFGMPGCPICDKFAKDTIAGKI